MWILPLILLFACAFFSFAEIAFTSCDVIKLRGLSYKTKNAELTYRFIKEPDRFLSTVVLGTNISLVGLSVILSNMTLPGRLMESILPLIITFSVLIFGEIIPKGIAYRFALPSSLVLSRVFIFIYWLFFPAILLVRTLARGILALLKITPGKGVIITEEEVKIGMAGLPPLEKKLVLQMLDFSDKRVEQVMLPRNRMVAVPLDIAIDELLKIAEKSGYSRIPVYEDNIDNIVGFIRIKEIITSYIMEKPGDIKDNRWLYKFIHKCMFVPPYKHIEELWEEMKKEFKYIAIVKDEYGGTLGLVSLEDILEELFGEIRDEYDFLEPGVESKGPISIVSGDTDLDELRYEMDIDIKEIGTVSSLLLKTGAKPRVGEKFTFNSCHMEIISIYRRRIDKVKIEKITL